MYGNVTKEEIEKMVNDIMKKKKITLEYYNNDTIIKITSPEMGMLVGSAKTFDDAMIELANEKYKPKR